MPRKKETPEQWRARSKRYYDRNKERLSAERKAKRRDPELREKFREYHRKYYKLNVKRKYKYGITAEQFDALLAKQGGKCSICRTDNPDGRTWHLDHSHEFDRRDPVGHRGVLCCRCNVMLAMARDNPETLREAAEYLLDHRLIMKRNQRPCAA